MKRHFRPAIAHRLCLVAEGRFDSLITLRPAWEWDIAAGALISEEAGARVMDRHGAPLIFNSPARQTAGVITGARAVAEGLLSKLKP